MADVVNKTDFQVRRSVNTGDFPAVDWVINSPNLDALVGGGTDDDPDTPKIYWIVDPPASQNLRVMTGPEQAVVNVDPTALANARTKRDAELRTETLLFLRARYSQEVQVILNTLALAVTGPDRAEINAWARWVARDVYGDLTTALDAVAVAVDIPAVEAVVIDFAALDASDPGVELGGAGVALTTTVDPGHPLVRFEAEDDSLSTTTSLTPVLKVQLDTVDPIPAGTYLIEWDFLWYRTSGASRAHFEIDVDSGTVVWHAAPPAPTNSATNRIPSSGSQRVQLTNAAHTIDLNYYDGGTPGATVGIAEAHVRMRWVGPTP